MLKLRFTHNLFFGAIDVANRCYGCGATMDNQSDLVEIVTDETGHLREGMTIDIACEQREVIRPQRVAGSLLA